MNLQAQVPYSSIPVAGAFTIDLAHVFLKINATEYIDLGSAVISGSANPAQLWYYLPNASIALG